MNKYDREFLWWMIHRLVNVYKESEYTDFVLRLKQIAGPEPRAEEER
jgi:hypothetical protein